MDGPNTDKSYYSRRHLYTDCLETVYTKHAHNPDRRGLAGTQRKTHRMLREVGSGHGETGVLEPKKDWV